MKTFSYKKERITTWNLENSENKSQNKRKSS